MDLAIGDHDNYLESLEQFISLTYDPPQKISYSKVMFSKMPCGI